MLIDTSHEERPYEYCPTCEWGVVLGVDDEQVCHDCMGAFIIGASDVATALGPTTVTLENE